MNGNANTNSAVVVSATNNANVVVSANKRKIGGGSRPNSTRIPKNKGTMDRSIPVEGIYGNPRFMNVSGACLGCVARVHTVNGECYEGIFRTFSNTFDCVLQMCHKIDQNNLSKHGLSLAENDEIINSLIFKLSDMISVTAPNADLEYATKDMFATDTIISKFNGQVGVNEKELEPWDEVVAEPENVSNSLDMDNANGWDVNDMFRTNEQQYGVQSSYDSTLSGYTTQLEKKNTDEYKKREAKALKLATEIESSSIHRARSALENVDEDEKISAVVRPGENNFGKYVPPAKRKNQQTGKHVRGNTGSNSSQGGYNMSGGMPHLSHSQMHGGGGPGGGYSRPPHSNNASNNSSGPPQHHSINSQTSSAGHYVHRQQTSPPGLNSNLSSSVGITNSSSGGVSENVRKTSHHHHHHQLQTQSMVVTDSDARLNCESRVAEKLEEENNKSKPTQPQHGTGESVRREAIAVNDSRNDTSSELNSSNSGGVAIHQQPPNSVQMQLGNNHISQKLSRKTMLSKANRDEETAELKKFQTNFKLPLNEDKEEPNNVSTSTVDEVEVKDKLESDLDKIANGVKKSSLNPNAKEFVFNPNAKAFTPRTPSTQTPTPPRAHTPGSIMTQQATISLVPGQHYIATNMPPYMMSSSQLATVSLTSPMGPAATSALTMHQAVGPRMRKNDNDHYAQMNAESRRYVVEAAQIFPFATAPTGVPPRPDFSHVAAATGQPILAPTALTSQPSFVQYGTPQAMVAAHGGPQHNMPYASQMYSVIGPRLMTAQGMSMVSASHLVQNTDPQHVPSQMFLSPHPGVPPQLTPGPTPPHGNHTPIPNMNQSGPHNASSQGQGQQQNQVTSMHPNPSPVHGGNTPTQQNPNNQPQGTPNAQQMNAYSNPHAPNMTSAQLQGASHTPNSPQSMHPGQVNNSNTSHYLQAVAHAAASNASPHANQAHQHPSQGGFPGTQMVLLPPPGPGTPTSITGHPTMSTHTLQGHALGLGGVTQLVPHASMVIPATSAGQLQAGAHQLFMSHHGGRPNALPGRVVCAVPSQPYQL